MAEFKAINTDTGEVVVYTDTTPRPDHLNPPWSVYRVEPANPPPPTAPMPTDPTKFGGRRRLTKLEFIELLGFQNYATLLALAKTDTEVAAWAKLVELAMPDPDGMPIDLDDPRTAQGIRNMEAKLVEAGAVSVGWADEVLNG